MGHAPGASVISLCDYRRRRAAERSGRRLKGMGFPDDLVFGPDDRAETFLKYPVVSEDGYVMLEDGSWKIKE